MQMKTTHQNMTGNLRKRKWSEGEDENLNEKEDDGDDDAANTMGTVKLAKYIIQHLLRYILLQPD